MKRRNVFITGANRGIGLELCKQLLSDKNPPKNLFAACRNPVKAEELNILKGKSTETIVHIIKLDVSNDDEIKAAAEQVSKIVGDDGVHLLINNAGINEISSFPGTPSKVYMNHFKVNTVAPILISEAFLPMLKLSAANGEQEMSCERSAIINITGLIAHFSHIGFKILHDIEAYRLSKVALNMGNGIMARNLKDFGILVVAIHPGWVATDMGGPAADLKTEESVSAVLSTMKNLCEKEHGFVVDYTGKKLDW